MNLPENYQPEYESLKYRLLELAQIHSVDALLQYVVKGALNRPHTALTQIWLVDPCGQHEACPGGRSVRTRRAVCIWWPRRGGHRTNATGADWTGSRAFNAFPSAV
jgi:hypothetical protein